MLGWYIPGPSELPLEHRLLPLLAEPFQRFFVFSINFALSIMFSFFFGSCACVYSEHGTAGEPGAVAGVSGCGRIQGGSGGARFAVFVARRRVFIETQGKHAWALSGLLLWSWM